MKKATIDGRTYILAETKIGKLLIRPTGNGQVFVKSCTASHTPEGAITGGVAVRGEPWSLTMHLRMEGGAATIDYSGFSRWNNSRYEQWPKSANLFQDTVIATVLQLASDEEFESMMQESSRGNLQVELDRAEGKARELADEQAKLQAQISELRAKLSA